MSNKMKELRKVYESTEIPTELSVIVANALCQNENEIPKDGAEILEQGASKMSEQNNKKRLWRSLTAGAAAIVVLVGVFGYNVSTNEAFADSVSHVPILSSLARVFIGEQIDEMDDVVHVEMTLPKVEGLTDKAVEDRINKEIHDQMTSVVAESKERAAEDKKAWLDTGGVEAEYRIRDITVDYEVKAVTDDVLSFVVSKLETGASAYYELFYYNINLKSNERVTLEELLGSDYIAVANRQIEEELAVRKQDPNNMYFDGSDGIDGFKTITKEQNFYVNQTGNPVVVFNKYEIAPGYMGIQEFEIKK